MAVKAKSELSVRGLVEDKLWYELELEPTSDDGGGGRGEAVTSIKISIVVFKMHSWQV